MGTEQIEGSRGLVSTTEEMRRAGERRAARVKQRRDVAGGRGLFGSLPRSEGEALGALVHGPAVSRRLASVFASVVYPATWSINERSDAP
jgi:hypothetical protein